MNKSGVNNGSGDTKPAMPLTSARSRDGDTVKPAASLTPTQPKISSTLLHRRLMHASPKAMSDTSKYSVGVALSDDPLKMQTPIDEECITGKGHKTAADAGE